MQRLAKDLLVVVDCSTLDANERDDLFMSSRDRVAEESPLFTELERSLEEALHEHPGLRDLRNRRAQEDIKEQLSDNKPLESVLKQVFKNSPALAKLFAKGERLSTPFKPESVQPDPTPPKLHSHPTFFHFSGKEAGETLKRAGHLEQRCRIAFTTDAVDDFFTRKYDAGKFALRILTDSGGEPVKSFIGPNLVRGRAALSFDLPANVNVGDVLTYESVVEDEIMQRTFTNRFVLQVAAAQPARPPSPSVRPQPPGAKPGPVPDGQSGIALPKVVRLKRSDSNWPEHFDDELGCLDVIEDSDEINGKRETTYTFYLNEENVALRTELKASRANAPVLMKQFEIASVLLGLALIHDQQQVKRRPNSDESNDDKDAEAGLQERVRTLSRAAAPVLLPMIQALGELGEDDLDESDLAGMAEPTSDVDSAA